MREAIANHEWNGISLAKRTALKQAAALVSDTSLSPERARDAHEKLAKAALHAAGLEFDPTGDPVFYTKQLHMMRKVAAITHNAPDSMANAAFPDLVQKLARLDALIETATHYNAMHSSQQR